MAEQATRMEKFAHFEGWNVCVPALEARGWTDLHEVKLHDEGSNIAKGYRLAGTDPEGKQRAFLDRNEVLDFIGERRRRV